MGCCNCKVVVVVSKAGGPVLPCVGRRTRGFQGSFCGMRGKEEGDVWVGDWITMDNTPSDWI
jgi:hypothetical protein